jgi:hypothetical protein
MITVVSVTPKISGGCLEFDITKYMMPHIGVDVHASIVVKHDFFRHLSVIVANNDPELATPSYNVKFMNA